jgi:hypothetical protein
VASKTGWLEKWNRGMVLSILEVQYHRVKVKKGPKKKGAGTHSFRDSELYYVLDKKIDLGELTLTGNSVFAKNEIVEVELPVTKHKTRLRLLGKIYKTTTFMEMQRVVFRGHLQFAAVNKQDFDLLVSLENTKPKAPSFKSPAKRSPDNKSGLKITFKRKS